ncbi:MAG: phosphodiester glycosidase family protein [Sandaracinaceae bacterium]|nr:phosphodiester glycosidase family protein [Sandaracinaceae bacterium]
MIVLPLTPARVAVLSLLAVGACAGADRAPGHGQSERAATHAAPAPTARDGITIERVAGPASSPPTPSPPTPSPATRGGEGRDGMVTLVRIDLARFRLTLLTEAENEGAWRTLPEWAAREHLVAGINAAMFEPEGRASGLLVDDGVERAPDDPRFGGVLAFDPIDPSAPPFVMVGRDCEGVDLASLRARYRSLVANYRMLDCDRAPIAWVDESVYSSAAFARDREGRFVLIHAETPYRMRDLAQTLADPALGLTDVHYVEGGPKASLWIDDGTGTPRSLVGSRVEDDGRVERGPRPIPNVLGVIAR